MQPDLRQKTSTTSSDAPSASRIAPATPTLTVETTPAKNTPASSTFNTKATWKIVSYLATFWLLVVVLLWLGLHAPFMPPLPSNLSVNEVAAGLGSTLINLALLPLMTLAACACGLRLLDWVLPQNTLLNQGERLVVGAGFGLGAIGFLILALGAAGWLGWPLAYGLLIAALAFNYSQTRQLVQRLGQTWPKVRQWWHTNNWVRRALALYLVGVLGLTLLEGLLPPTAWDSLMYHLTAPKLYLEAGKIGPLNQMFPSNYPFGTEMLFSWAMALHNDTLAQAVHWLFGLLTVITLLLMANRFFTSFNPAQRQLVGLLAASFYLSVPLVQTLLTWAYTDLLVAFYALLALYLLLLILHNPDFRKLWLRLAMLAGIMGGLSFGGKYWAVLALAGVGLAFLAVGAQEKLKPRQLWGTVVIFGLTTAAISAPWLVRNWVFSDNPTAPFVWGARGWTKGELSSFSTGNGLSLNLFGIVALPWKLTISGQTGSLYDATISPLFLGLAPVIVLAAIRDRLTSRASMLAVGVQFVAWVAVLTINSTLNETRALTPAFPLLAMVAAYGLVTLRNIKAAYILRNFASLIVSIYLATNLLNQLVAFAYTDPLQFLTGLQPRSYYLESALGSYWRAADFVSEKLPAEAHLMSWLEPRSYYFNRYTLPDFHTDEMFYYFSHYPDPDQLAKVLKEQGFTHILLSEHGLQFMLDTPDYGRVTDAQAALLLLAKLKATHLAQLYEEPGQYAIYTLR